MTTPPLLLQTDKGGELKSNQFKAFCVKNKVKLIQNQTSYHCALIERFQRSMQRIIYQYCTDKSTYKFYDKLPLLLKTYNCRPNRSLGHQISPEMAESGNHDRKISEAKSKYLASFKRKSPKYKVNDFVRIRSEREKFYKSYRPTFNDEMYNRGLIVFLLTSFFYMQT